MSLVNKMLKDLQESNQTSVLFEQEVAVDEPNTQTLRIAGVFLLAALGALVFFWQDWVQQAQPIKQKITHEFEHRENVKHVTSASQKPGTSKTPVEEIKRRLNTVVINEKPALAKKAALAIEKPTIEPEKSLAAVNKETPKPEKPVFKKRSKQDIAKKQLQKIINGWSTSANENGKKALEQLLINNPKNAELAIQVVNFSKAESVLFYHSLLKIARANLPKNSHLSLISAQQSFSKRRYLKAINTLKEVDSYYWETSHYQLVGLSYQKLKRHEEAIRVYKKLLDISPNNGKINMAIAISYEATNQLSQARANYLFAIEDKRLDSIQRQYIKQRLVAYQG